MSPTTVRHSLLRFPILVGAVAVLFCAGAAHAQFGMTTTITSTTLGAGATGSLVASCPAGTSALGGGVDGEDLTLISSAPYFAGGSLYSRSDGANPAPVGWRAVVRNELGSTATIKVAAICSGIDVMTQVDSINASPGNAGGLFVYCPAGKAAVSGGSEPELTTMWTVVSRPRFGDTSLHVLPDGEHDMPTAWTSVHRNTDAMNPRRVRVGVVCVAESFARTFIRTTSFAGDTQHDGELCTLEISQATGGGVSIDSGNSQELHFTAPKMNLFERLLEISDRTDGLPPLGWAAEATHTTIGADDAKWAAICSSLIFGGGFESGNTSRWDASVP